jgi:hypothetical protein
MRGSNANVVSRRVSKVRKSRLFTPISGVASASASQLGGIVHFNQHAHPGSVRASDSSSCICPSSSAATINRMQSRPSLGLHTPGTVDGEVLRSTEGGRPRARNQVIGTATKNSLSVSTRDMRAMALVTRRDLCGNEGSRTALLGLAFLISAITRTARHELCAQRPGNRARYRRTQRGGEFL